MQILLIDDHSLVREGVAHVLKGLATNVVVHEAKDARTALALLETDTELDLILVDLDLPDAGPFDVLRGARRLQPQVPVVIVSATESRYEIERVMTLGAQGYIFKSSSGQQLLAALRRVMQGELFFPPADWAQQASPNAELTARQREVLGLLARGLSNKEIGAALDVAENTVKVHLAAIYRVLGVTGRAHAVLKAQRLGIHGDDA